MRQQIAVGYILDGFHRGGSEPEGRGWQIHHRCEPGVRAGGGSEAEGRTARCRCAGNRGVLGLGALPVPIEAVPLEGSRDAGRWIQRVMAIDAGLVVVDCPPHLSHATEAAVGVADLVIISVTPSGADLVATASAVTLVSSKIICEYGLVAQK